MPPVQHASQIAGQDKQQVTAQDATQATRQRVLVGALALGIAFSLSMQTVSAQTNTVRYDDIAGKAKQAPGPAVAISTNYFLAWTGAWDSVILREREIWKKWLPQAAASSGNAI